MTSLASPEYLITIAVIGVYLLLQLNLFPALTKKFRPRSFLVVVLCAIVLRNVAVHHEMVIQSFGVDRVTPTVNAIEKLNEALPDVSRVGFLTDIEGPEQSEWLQRYFLTRYALAPRLVEVGSGPEWVVVISSGNDSAFVGDLALVQNFGEGVSLFRRKVK